MEKPSNEKHYKYVFGESALFSPRKVDYPFSEVLKDFSNFYDLSYSQRLEIAEKYDISTFYIFLDKEKELIFGVDFAKNSEVEENLREVLKCTPKDIFDFVPKDEHTKRYFEVYQKKYFEEDEEIIFFEWFMKKFNTKIINCELWINDYWNQMAIDNFPEEYLNETILDIKHRVEEGLYYHRTEDMKNFFLFGAIKYKRGITMPFNGYKRELDWFWRSDAVLSYFEKSLVYIIQGYQTAKFYKFLIEQQKRLLKGEDITRPFEVEEKEKPIKLEGFQVGFAILIIMNLGEIAKKGFETDIEYFLRVCKELNYNPTTYRTYYYDCTNLLLNGAETMKVFENKMKDLERVKKYFGNDEKYIKEIDEMINKIKTKSN